MNMNKLKDNSNSSSYPRSLSSIIVSVGLLALFITFASWVLLSYPISTAVKSYFYGVNGIADLSSSASWQSITPIQINNTETALIKDSRSSPQLKVRDGLDANREDEYTKSDEEKPTDRQEENSTPDKIWQNTTSSKVDNSEKATTAFNVSSDVQQSLENGKLDANQKDNDDEKAKEKPSEVSNNENTTQGVDNGQELQKIREVEGLDVNQDKQRADDGKIDHPLSEGTNKNNLTDYSSPSSPEGECDLFHGEWYYDESGSLYTNNSCPIITQMQNCQGNGRPDKGYESWRWKPSKCILPKFDANKFLELMSGKTLAFVGDSVARNQMESLLCILWQVEVPKNRGNRHMQRWLFRSKSVMIVRIWSSWLVRQTGSAFKEIPEGVTKVFLDVPDETFMEHAPEFDVIVLSSGHWFAKQSVYVNNNEVVGTQLWAPPNRQKLPVNNVEAFGIAVDTAITALATHPNYTGITILRSYSPDHYEGGAWNTGGSCTGKVEPARPDQLADNAFTNVMHEKQVTGFDRATKKQTNRSKLKLMDITEVFSYRHDGHPGPYRSTDPNKITRRGPDGRPPPQDCLHWCMPGPVDTWNEFVLEIIRRELEK
ncbi:hypothetical protein V2J09_012134 [Rumex salicifolius]